MQSINYILINDSAAKGSVYKSRHRFIPHIGHCILCGFAGFACQDSGSRELRPETWNLEQQANFISELVRLRFLHPDAKILGISEINGNSIRPSDKMNELRRKLSDLP